MMTKPFSSVVNRVPGGIAGISRSAEAELRTNPADLRAATGAGRLTGEDSAALLF